MRPRGFLVLYDGDLSACFPRNADADLALGSEVSDRCRPSRSTSSKRKLQGRVHVFSLLQPRFRGEGSVTPKKQSVVLLRPLGTQA
jgi:hypothetical protein